MRISDALRLLAGVVTAAVLTAVASPAMAFDGRPTNDMRSPLQAFRDGARALRDGRPQEAVSALQFAADQGHVASAWKLGRMYMDGDGVARSDLRAFDAFRKITAERAEESPSSPDARFVASAFVATGTYWLEGIPNTHVRPNPARAFELYHYAASYFGDADGQYRLGRMFLDGVGTTRDPRQAARWLSLATQKSHHKAQAVLGHMLFVGADLPRQAPRGLMLLTLAKEASTDDEAWITELYDDAMRAASDDERGVALRMVETWLGTQRR
ncbi:MAG: tetratricopeptide repeat protein [Alphaproteobacteria bacterium]|jgi:TPR repeat protein